MTNEKDTLQNQLTEALNQYLANESMKIGLRAAEIVLRNAAIYDVPAMTKLANEVEGAKLVALNAEKGWSDCIIVQKGDRQAIKPLIQDGTEHGFDLWFGSGLDDIHKSNQSKEEAIKFLNGG